MFHKSFLALCLIVLAPLALKAAPRQFTVVIDAGHGGNDSGAKGLISYEKNLTLRYALAVGKAIEKNFDDVRVVYTRRTDVFLPLHERADIANHIKADLFMSVHINALAGGKISRGFQSYTLGNGERTGTKGIQENLEVAKRENSVIFLEKDYKTRYKGLENSAEGDIMFELIADKNRERSVELSRLLQTEVCRATGRENGGAHQNNLAVLRLTSMPAVLLELGFITTPDEETYLNTDAALDAFTSGIVNAFRIYKQRNGSTDTEIPFNDNANDGSSEYMSANIAAADDDAKTTRAIRQTTERKRDNVQEQKKQTAQETKKQTAQEQKKQTAREESKKTERVRQTDKNAPVFKIQIFAGKQKLNDGSQLFKGLKNCESFTDGDKLRYTYGASANYNEIKKLRGTILDKFPDCFIIAMKNGKVMDVNKAIKEFLENKKKK